MTAKQLSLVMPVYNGAHYIAPALAALTVQLTDATELLVIDDGSTDSTGQIIRDQFARYVDSGALRLLVQPNLGVSAARNAGISAATGDYIGFVDADDMVLPGYVTAILDAMASGADIIEFGYKTFYANIDEVAGNPRCYTNRRFGLHRASAVLDGVHAIARWYPWTRVCKAALFDDLSFPPGVRVCEDVMTVPRLYEKAATVLNLAAALYGYRHHPASATFTIRPDYVPNLERFYQTIPRDGLRRHDYLRLAIAYSVHSCQRKAGHGPDLPQAMAADMRRLRYVPAVYRDIGFRKMCILLYPSVVNLARRIAALVH